VPKADAFWLSDELQDASGRATSEAQWLDRRLSSNLLRELGRQRSSARGDSTAPFPRYDCASAMNPLYLCLISLPCPTNICLELLSFTLY
jgi:hypothetical protein